jgi:hypothetical protein
MKEFQVEVCETLVKVITIKAETIEDAIDKARTEYNHAEIILDAEDLLNVEFYEFYNE